MNATPITGTVHLITLAEYTREMRSTEVSRWNAMDTGRKGLVNALEDKWTALNNARLTVVLKAMRAGIPAQVLTFVCQGATNRQLMILATQDTYDSSVITLAESMM